MFGASLGKAGNNLVEIFWRMPKVRAVVVDGVQMCRISPAKMCDWVFGVWLVSVGDANDVWRFDPLVQTVLSAG